MDMISEKDALEILGMSEESFIKRYIEPGIISIERKDALHYCYNIADIVEIAIAREYESSNVVSIDNIIRYLELLNKFGQITTYDKYESGKLDACRDTIEYMEINVGTSRNRMIRTDGIIRPLEEKGCISLRNFGYIAYIELDRVHKTVQCDLVLSTYNIIGSNVPIVDVLSLARRLEYRYLY